MEAALPIYSEPSATGRKASEQASVVKAAKPGVKTRTTLPGAAIQDIEVGAKE